MKKIVISTIVLIIIIGIIGSIMLFFNNEQEYENGVTITGSVKNTDESNVILHFSTWQNTTDLSSVVRKSRAASQFLFFDKNGDLDNQFAVNREILCNPIVQMENSISYGYSDFCLLSNGKSINFIDDETKLDLSSMTKFGPQTSGFIKKHNCAYYLLNLGSNAISGQYTTVLRFTTQTSSYDIVIPKPVYYVAYDNKYDRFIYRLSDDVDAFVYGYISFNNEKNKYEYSEPEELISKETINKKYGYESTGYGVLLDGDFAYELIICDINETILQECNLSSESVDSGKRAGVLMLCKYDLLNHAISCDYLSKEIIYGDDSYGFVLSGTQSMPLTISDNKLYLFTRNNKVYIFDVEKGVEDYNLSFDFDEVISPSNPFDDSSMVEPTFGDGSPLIIDNGNIYIGHIYKGGIVKIHKYNFDKEEFDLYWESNESILSTLNKNSLEFISFEIIE